MSHAAFIWWLLIEALATGTLNRDRRKSSQKLTKRRAFVWERGGGGGNSTVFTKQAEKKGAAGRLRALLSAEPCNKSIGA